jgi:mxaJ protein
MVRTAFVAAILLGAASALWFSAPPPRVLRVCADPNNLPFSDAQGGGFENRIAELLANALDARLEYMWWAQRRGYLRNSLKAGRCDVLIGVPADMEGVLATRPYYRSTYVFVSRTADALQVDSFDDAVLRRLTVGVQIIGDDYANTPPAHALGRRGIVSNVRGYPVAGDYTRSSPPARIMDAVVRGDVDVAIAWGPLAGYFASRSPVPLSLHPVRTDEPGLPLAYDIAMGVRPGDKRLRDELDHAIESHGRAIDAILDAYGIPRQVTASVRADVPVAALPTRTQRP